jgi:hypothetical protein
MRNPAKWRFVTVGDGPWRSAGAGYESEGRRFESCRACPSSSCICRSFSCSSVFSAASTSGFDGSRVFHWPVLGAEKQLPEGLGGLLLELRGDARVVFHLARTWTVLASTNFRQRRALREPQKPTIPATKITPRGDAHNAGRIVCTPLPGGARPGAERAPARRERKGSERRKVFAQ